MTYDAAHLTGRPIAVSSVELDRRRACLVEEVSGAGCDLLVTLEAASLGYLSGYCFTPNERPFAALLDDRGELTLVVPRLKEFDVSIRARADRIISYDDYPGHVHPMRAISSAIERSGARRPLLDSVGHASPFGYHGPTLSECLPLPTSSRPGLVQRVRMVKSAEEIQLLRHASDWAVLAQGLLTESAVVGRTESQAAGAATSAAVGMMRAIYGRDRIGARPLSVSAGFGGQIGPDGTAHHLQLEMDPELRSGDLMITRVAAHVGGYYSDAERTMVCEHVTPNVADLFARGLDIHEFALEQVLPGRPASEVDRLVWKRFEELGIVDERRHHVGHGVGLLEREEPYLDVGTRTVLEPGMVVTVEPGLYRPGIGGFRHSDLLLVTDSGSEVLTEYPRDIVSLTCHDRRSRP